VWVRAATPRAFQPKCIHTECQPNVSKPGSLYYGVNVNTHVLGSDVLRGVLPHGGAVTFFCLSACVNVTRSTPLRPNAVFWCKKWLDCGAWPCALFVNDALYTRHCCFVSLRCCLTLTSHTKVSVKCQHLYTNVNRPTWLWHICIKIELCTAIDHWFIQQPLLPSSVVNNMQRSDFVGRIFCVFFLMQT